MKEEEIDRILKNRMYNELRAPKKLKRRISYEIKNININSNKNMYSKLRLIKSMAAIAVFSILGITTFQIFNEKIQKEENLRTQVLASYNGESGKNIPDGKLGSEELKAIGDFIKL